ncbi:TnsA-like heteromeric transposase endonuclease subunit [Streptomyces sp. NPDC048644]|uniref:TnsA-like heteromeric transposase endonuclease subunit n=1 Tax=Streptomyces sp. NPDC048644 TaxID=3365582 RepID=UPI003723461B
MAAFRWYSGQKHYSGTYWSATVRDHVIYESRLELARLLFADFDSSVRGIVAQPFLLKAEVAGKVRKHIPDYLLTTEGGPVVRTSNRVIGCRSRWWLSRSHGPAGRWSHVGGATRCGTSHRTRVRAVAVAHRPTIAVTEQHEGGPSGPRAGGGGAAFVRHVDGTSGTGAASGSPTCARPRRPGLGGEGRR